MSLSESKLLQSVLQSAVVGGKYVLGAKEVIDSVKSSRLVVIASNAPPQILKDVWKACNASAVPVLTFNGSSLELGRICKKPYRVVAVGVKSPGSVDITPLLKAVEEGKGR